MMTIEEFNIALNAFKKDFVKELKDVLGLKTANFPDPCQYKDDHLAIWKQATATTINRELLVLDIPTLIAENYPHLTEMRELIADKSLTSPRFNKLKEIFASLSKKRKQVAKGDQRSDIPAPIKVEFSKLISFLIKKLFHPKFIY